MAFGKPKTPLTPEQQLQRRQNIGVGLAALSESLRGGDPVGRTLGLQQQLEAQQQQAEQDKLLQQFAQTNPELAQMYNLFGERGLQQTYLSQQEQKQNIIRAEQQIQRYKNAGFTDQEINLLLSDMTPKDVIELRQTGVMPEPKTPEQLTKEVQEEKQKDPDYIKKLENMDQAFGPIDALQQRITESVGPVLPFLVEEDTAETVSVKNVLNERIREKFVNQYSGRPSVYINQRVDLLLPLGEYMTEDMAASKYQSTKKVLEEGLNEMKSKMDSGLYTGTERLEVEQNYKDIQSIVSDLDIVIRSLEKAKPEKQSLEPISGMAAQGTYDQYFTD
jgi:hypothetical protein